jgi:hypothetical protein
VGAVRVILAARPAGSGGPWPLLAVLVGLGTVVVLAAVTAGRRADSAFPRFVAAHGYDAVVYANGPLPLARLPGVARTVPIQARGHRRGPARDGGAGHPARPAAGPRRPRHAGGDGARGHGRGGHRAVRDGRVRCQPRPPGRLAGTLRRPVPGVHQRVRARGTRPGQAARRARARARDRPGHARDDPGDHRQQGQHPGGHRDARPGRGAAVGGGRAAARGERRDSGRRRHDARSRRASAARSW